MPVVPAGLPGRSKTRPQHPEALSALSALRFPQLVPMKGEHSGGGGGVSREEMGDSDRTQAMPGLGKVPDTAPPRLLPHKDTHAQGTQTATEVDICRIPTHAPMTPLPSAFLPSSWEMKDRAGEDRKSLTVSAHLPGLCLQGPGWPQSPPATCPQLCDSQGHL